MLRFGGVKPIAPTVGNPRLASTLSLKESTILGIIIMLFGE